MLNVPQGLMMRNREESQFRSGDTRALLGFSLSCEALHKRLVIGRNGGGAGTGQEIAMMLHYLNYHILSLNCEFLSHHVLLYKGIQKIGYYLVLKMKMNFWLPSNLV
jgi:hypothetical protein